MGYSRKSHDEIIKKSHQRSEQYGIEKERKTSKKILTGEAISCTLERNQKLVEVAATFIKNLYDFLVGSGFFIILTDKEGCILNVIGDEEILEAAEELDMIVGAYMNEESIGTNAMGTAINENMPIQVSAKEHFITAYHKWTCSAAPIHDELGNIIGTLNLTGNSNSVNPHTLGLVVAAVNSIENQMENNKAQKKILETYYYMDGIMDSISYGIFAIDRGGIVKVINQTACKMTQLKEEEIKNHSVEKILLHWKEIYKRLEGGSLYQDEEVTFSTKGAKERYNINAYPIQGDKSEIIGMVIMLKEIQKVINLVNKYTGMRARYVFEDIIGKSEEINKVIEFSKKAAASPSTILIEGESGTGKELFAQAIHNESDRAENGFIAINCGAIPSNLIESELFGYDDGAFTGAKRGGHAGKFELANGGTLFLDEIGEMTLDMQVRLLRVLQEGTVTRLGGSKVIPVDIRVIAATNKDLRKEVAKGNFRQDLYYRLSVIPIIIPPLRERKGDLLYLVEYFIKKKTFKLKKAEPKISKELYHKLVSYEWPGNIRELENFVENIVNFNGNTTFDLRNEPVQKLTEGVLKSEEEKLHDRELISLDEMEKSYITSVLVSLKWNVTQAAKVLGISRNTLYCKMKKYKIEYFYQ